MKAIREGKWVLLDEINLASAETLQRLSGLLEVCFGGFGTMGHSYWGSHFAHFFLSLLQKKMTKYQYE